MKTRTLQGKRGMFEYEHVPEQNGVRKGCCIPIPHFELPYNHSGLHSTTHGNMTGVNFASEDENIDILDRRYKWGESGLTEMCMMQCKNQGREHAHLTLCPSQTNGSCAAKLVDGVRHETCKYGPQFDTPKYEYTHAAYWKSMRFKDPCSEEDQRIFSLCSYHYNSNEQTEFPTSSTSANTSSERISYFQENLWHPPISNPAAQASRLGSRT